MSPRPAILEVRDVSRSYFEDSGEVKVLDVIRFEEWEGDFVCVGGPSGCGKSTLLKIIVGLDRPTSGEVLFEGRPMRADNPQVAMVFQSFALFPWLTVEQNVAVGLEARHEPADEAGALAREDIEAGGLGGVEN